MARVKRAIELVDELLDEADDQGVVLTGQSSHALASWLERRNPELTTLSHWDVMHAVEYWRQRTYPDMDPVTGRVYY